MWPLAAFISNWTRKILNKIINFSVFSSNLIIISFQIIWECFIRLCNTLFICLFDQYWTSWSYFLWVGLWIIFTPIILILLFVHIRRIDVFFVNSSPKWGRTFSLSNDLISFLSIFLRIFTFFVMLIGVFNLYLSFLLFIPRISFH